jgi:manganese efflux pump family protein
MGLATVLLIAVGLAMDAAAVSVSCGLGLRPLRLRPLLAMAGLFGLFQALMPLAGWLAGLSMRRAFAAYDHWLAFTMLALIGARMIREARRARACEPGETRERFPGAARLLALALATSIDALAVGLSFSLLRVSILGPVLLIGLVTFLLSLAAAWLGHRLGALIAREAEIVGGLVLLGIGLKILLQHLAGKA